MEKPHNSAYKTPISLTYDIILGDFGRLASVEYARILTNAEKSRIQRSKDPGSAVFFDEERRIMFTLLCEIEWFKRRSIKQQIKRTGEIDRRILIGIGDDDVADEFVENATASVLKILEYAIARGYGRIRLYVPCNGLSDLVLEIAERCCRSLFGLHEAEMIKQKRQTQIRDGRTVFEVASVPDSVVTCLTRKQKYSTALILGTRGVNEIYRKHFERAGVSVFSLTEEEYVLIHDVIVASIGDAGSKMDAIIREVSDTIIKRFRLETESGVIVEACTDFNLGLGKSSLRLFAEEMVRNVYE